MSLFAGNSPKRSRFSLLSIFPRGTKGSGHEPSVGSGSDVPLVISLPSTQSVDAIRVERASDQTVLWKVTSTGGQGATAFASGAAVSLTSAALTINGGSLALPTAAGAGSAVIFSSGNGNYVEIGGSGLIAGTDNSSDLGGLNTTTNRFRDLFISRNAFLPTINYVGTENGANNAIACAAGTGPALTTGLIVWVQLAHTLQAGANTFAYLGGSALAIKSSYNSANNIGTGYAATGVIALMYNGTLWLDLKQ